MLEKMRKVIPRQMFEVSLQAAIGGKIIARKGLFHIEKMSLQNATVEM
jgi:GTP-binding protein LepA